MGLFKRLFKKTSTDTEKEFLFKRLNYAMAVFERADKDLKTGYELAEAFSKNPDINMGDAIFHFMRGMNSLATDKEMIFKMLDVFVRDNLLEKEQVLEFKKLVKEFSPGYRHNIYDSSSKFSKNHIRLLTLDNFGHDKGALLSDLEKKGLVGSLNRITEIIKKADKNDEIFSPGGVQIRSRVYAGDDFGCSKYSIGIRNKHGDYIDFNTTYPLLNIARMMYGENKSTLVNKNVLDPNLSWSYFNTFFTIFKHLAESKDLESEYNSLVEDRNSGKGTTTQIIKNK